MAPSRSMRRACGAERRTPGIKRSRRGPTPPPPLKIQRRDATTRPLPATIPTTYTDSFTVASADGTTSSVTVNIAGTNAAEVLSLALHDALPIYAVLTTGGTLTISDVDSPATFVAQAGTAGAYGTFAIDAAGV